MLEYVEDKPTVFSVSQMAKLFNISSQAVRYYHKEGILVPDLREENGYRKYRYNQIYTLTMIHYLRKAGMPIRDIQTYVKSASAQENIETLQDYIQRLYQQCADISKIIDILQRKIEFTEQESKHISFDNVHIQYFPERFYSKVGRELEFGLNESAFRYPTIVCYQPSNIPNHYVTKFGAYLESGGAQEDPELGPVVCIPAQRFLVSYHKGPYSEVFPRIVQLRQAYSQYLFADKTYCINIIDQFLESNQQNYVVCIQIPIEDLCD